MLSICKSFFGYLNDHGIRYCHWKSNSHLDLALAGKTDLDVLIHVDDKGRFEEALNSFPFKKIISPPEKQFPGLEDYLGFDYDTGEFIHLHVHYRLVLGQRFIKNHHFPLEDLFFNNLVLKDGVYIPCPELELLLLVIRAHMKVDMISLLKHAIRDITAPGYTAFPSHVESELVELIEASDIDKLKHLLEETKLHLDEKLFTEFLDRFMAKKLRFFHLVATQIEILWSLRRYKRDKSPLAYLKYLYLLMVSFPIVSKFMTSRGKTLAGEGKIISLVGADGAGKSTLIKDLEKWLSWKLSVSHYYYGIPKNTVSKMANFVLRGLNKFRLNYASSIIASCFWLYVARGRLKIHKNTIKDKRKGKMVITDRFPLKEFHSMPDPMDGPRLLKKDKSQDYFASMELECYENIAYPDCVYVLQVSIDELRRRKTDLGLETHNIKAEAVNQIKGSEKVKLINANKPYPEVLLEVKRGVWGLIMAN